MAGGWRQLRLLLWKDYLIRKRKLVTLGGIIWATLVMLSLYIVRANIDNQDFPTCQFPARALPSAGMLTFLQSFICSINNECSPMDQYDEIPTYENSRLTQLQRQFSPLLGNATVLETAAAVPDALKLLGTLSVAVDEPAFLHITKNGLRVKDLFQNQWRVKRNILIRKLHLSEDAAEAVIQAEISLQGVLKGNINRCLTTSLSEVILVEGAVSEALVQAICPISTEELQTLLVELLLEVDFSRYVKMLGNMYSRVSGGDARITTLGDTLTAVIRLTRLDSYLPVEVAHLFQTTGWDEEQFRYFNLTIISKVMDLFEPTFGNTDAYKSIRGLTDAAISGVQWLHRLFRRQGNTDPIADVTQLVLERVDGELKLNGTEQLTSKIRDAVETLGRNLDGHISLDEVFDVLSKSTSFIIRWLRKETQHDVLFYWTLVTRLMEGAHSVMVTNMRVVDIVYDMSMRNPGGVRVLRALPVHVVASALDGLADADRTMLITSKLNSPNRMFCDEMRLQGFLNISKQQVMEVKKQLCTEDWQKYVTDLVTSFGFYQVKNNINAMASLLIQETLGRDTSDQLYPIEKGFTQLKGLVRELLEWDSKPRSTVDWNTLLNVTDDSELMKVLRQKEHLGTQVLITIHGALAKEVIKQNTILDIKMTPILIDLSTIVVALNEQLASSNGDVVMAFRNSYGPVLQTMLTTLLDEDKTFGLLSTHSVDLFCNGTETAAKYLNFPADVDEEKLVAVLCDMTKEIEKGLQRNSFIGKAINKLKNSTSDTLGTVPWTHLVNGLKNLYTTLHNNYTYLFEFATYGMDEKGRKNVEDLVYKAKDYWIGKDRISKTALLSVNAIFRVLDLLDRDVFSFTHEIWLKLKYSLNSANGLLVICDEIVQLIFACITNNVPKDFKSGLPMSTFVALKRILPNVPLLIVDTTNIIVSDDTDVDKVIQVLNADPPWPCSETSMSQLLSLREPSKEAVIGLETILCMNDTFQQEWIEYGEAKKLKMIVTFDKANVTKFEPYLFLKFSSNFDALIKDANTLRENVEVILQDNTTELANPNFLTAVKYAVDALNRTDKESIFRKFFTKLDTVVNAINASSVRDTVPLNILWEEFIRCSNQTLIDDQCKLLQRTTWTNTIKFLSVMAKNVASDLLTYFTEINEPHPNVIQILGFTRNTGLYILYEKISDFAGVLLNSYWDYGFMNQIRRASESQFWDCEAVVEALVVPPGSPITTLDIMKVKPYVCPSLLYWVSLPRGENSFLDVISKPQYFFYTMFVQNLTSDYEGAFNKYRELTDILTVISSKNNTTLVTEEDIQINTIQKKVTDFVDYVVTWKLNETDPSYRLFNEINKKQYLSSIYFTRVITIINKMQERLDQINVKNILADASEEEVKKLSSDLLIIQKKFKRRPAEAVSLHFDLITDLLWKTDDGYSITTAFKDICENFKNTSSVKMIISEDKRFITQICSKNYTKIYEAVQDDVAGDLIIAKNTLQNLVQMLKTNEEPVVDIFQFFNKRKELQNFLKRSVKYSDELGLPIYLQYLQNNLHQYKIIVSFLSGQDWWRELRQLYNGSYMNVFFDTVERSIDIVKDVFEHLDQIHLVRLLRDINLNDTSSLCSNDVTIADYLPDSSGLLTALQRQSCDLDVADLALQLPIMRIVIQGYDNSLVLPKEINYTTLYADLNDTEAKLNLIAEGPRPPLRPGWITDEKVEVLRTIARDLFHKNTLTKVAFVVMSNVVDASTLFLNNSECVICSRLTTWFKQLNLQLFKKQDYDALLCHIDTMSLHDVHRALQQDFHWDMALRELISTRNYTNLELNKAINELLEQVKLHALDDVTRHGHTKLTDCLARNVSRNGLGNATLFVSVLSHTLKLIRAQLPHIQEIEGMKDVAFLKQLHLEVAPNLRVVKQLKELLKEDGDALKQFKSLDKDLIKDMEESNVDLTLLKRDVNSIERWLILSHRDWYEICDVNNCTKLGNALVNSIDIDWIEKNLPALQSREFWRLDFVSSILRHVESLLGHVARALGFAAKMDVAAILDGQLAAILDLVLQVVQEDTMATIVYSVKGLMEELEPILVHTPLKFDLSSVNRGLEIIGEYRSYIVKNMDLSIRVSEVFSRPERIEFGLSSIGINNTNFWSIAAPRIHAGALDLKPLLSSNAAEFRISSFVCQVENMSRVIHAENVDVVSVDDVYGAVIEQLCALSDSQAKLVLPVLVDNLNYTFVMDKLAKLILKQVYAASNLSESEGATVLAKYQDMVSLLPLVRDNFDNVTDLLAKEPVFEAFKDFSTIGDLLSSSKFLSSAGNMVCGKPFVGNSNRFYRAIANTQDFSNQPDPAQLDALPTDFCRSLYKDVLSMSGGKIVWSFVKPLLMGEILYTPDTSRVHDIVRQANSSFATAAQLADMVHKLSASFPSVELLATHRRGVEALQTLASSPLFHQLMMSGGDEEEEEDGGAGDLDLGGMFERVGDLKGIGALLHRASNLLRCINLNRFQAAPDERALTHQAVQLTRLNQFSAGLVFLRVEGGGGGGEGPTRVEYKIRMDIDSVPTTTRTRNQFWTPGPESSFLEEMRYFRGFVQIQDLVDSAIIQLSGGESRGRRDLAPPRVLHRHQYGVYTQQMPYPCYRRDYFQSSLYESQALIVAFFFALLFTVCSAIRFIVAEKESGNTMLMCVMGVSVRRHTFSWWVVSLVEMTATCACVLLVLCAGGVLPRSDPTLLLALLINYGFSVLMFCYLVSKLFKSASLAAVCGGLGYMVTFMPFVIILSLEAVLTDTAKFLTSLLMSTSFCYSVLHVARYEAVGVGARWSLLWTAPDHDDNFTIGVTALIVFLDGLIYLALGCLLDRFFGLRTLKSNITWCESSSEKGGVSIVNVSKVYGARAPRLALDNVSIELHRGQVTTLLGHNGAGKTTLIKIITGMLKPSKGHVVVRSSGGAAQEDVTAQLGVCPQHDVLFENLTAVEHLTLYAQLRGTLTREQCTQEVESMVSVLSLGGSAAVETRRLSGGLRRRLCVALAFLGRPRLVLLDEPSSGVDPLHRRDIWSLIVKLKEDRTVLLTTHHLDEAELLSDQVVIMHKGQVHSIGSPIEIKRSLGNGYTLSVTYRRGDDDVTEAAMMDHVTGSLVDAVRGVVRNAALSDVHGTEVEINLPFFDDNGLNNDYLRLCQALESRQEALGFKSFSLDCGNLEQVMFNICSPEPARAQPPPAHRYGTASSTSSTSESATATQSGSTTTSSVKNDRSPLVSRDGALRGTHWQQFRALLYKRALHYSRNRWLLFLVLVLPSLFVSIAMSFSMIRPPADNELSLRLHPAMYDNTTQFLVPEPSLYPTTPDLEPQFARSVMRSIYEHTAHYNWTDKDSPTCECVEHRQQCDVSDDVTPAPGVMLLPDVATLNHWLLNTQQLYIQKRYGGFTSALKRNESALVVWYNNKGHHAMPAYLNALNSAILRRVAGDSAAGITTYTHPLKISHEQLSKSTLLQHVADAGISGMLLLAYSLVGAGAAIYLVTERTTQQKRLQLLCGVSPLTYWGAAMLADVTIFVLNIVITACVLSAFGFPVFVARDNLPAICLLLFLFGISCSSLMHVLEKLFSDASLANMMLFTGNTFLGLSGIALLLILDIISDSEATDNARWTLHKIFLLSPPFALGDALVEIAKNTVQAQVLSRFGMDTYVSPLWGPLISYHYTALVLVAALLVALNLAIEYDYLQALTRWRQRQVPPGVRGGAGDAREMEEADVAAERRRVESSLVENNLIRLPTIGNINAGFITTEIEELKRSTPRMVTAAPCVGDVARCVAVTHRHRGAATPAVCSLTLGVPPGQCTALLGENGAGKSTTFSMLTGELTPTRGQLYLQERRVNARELCTGLISYCPQSDAIDPLLTVRETLVFYCNLRGITGQKEVIDRTLAMFDLDKYRRVRGGALSGGNKRKLCTAVAFMGRSPLVLLDEPTSGMDPGSRECVSRGVRAACGASRGVLLSTHALRDAARLARRVALLSAGRLRAVHDIDECLTRFGGGAVVCVRLRRGVDARCAWRALHSRAPHALLRALHAQAIQVLLPHTYTVDGKECRSRLSDIFRLMAELQVSCDIEDFTLNQSSLDEMFLSLTDSNKREYDVDLPPASPPHPRALPPHDARRDTVTSL